MKPARLLASLAAPFTAAAIGAAQAQAPPQTIKFPMIGVDGTIQVNLSNNPAAYIITATGKARFQRPRALGPSPCAVTDRC